MKVDQLKELVLQIEQERNIVKQVLDWKIDNLKTINQDFIKTILMIVESPNKARTISNFFWKPSRRTIKWLNVYEVNLWNKLLLITACWGHIVDLITKTWIFWVEKNWNKFYPIYDSIKRCIYKYNPDEQVQITDDFSKCESIVLDKRDYIQALQKVSLEVDEVYLATDPDTEWEKISYDLYCLLKPFNGNLFRIEYHEVTKKAILKAIDEKRQIDENLVRAQIVRRVADRWVWFSLSEKLQAYYNNPNYSAWRVQTPVLWWVIKRDEEWKEKKAIIYIKFDENEDSSLGSLNWFYFKNTILLEEENTQKVKDIKKTNKVQIKIVDTKKVESKPSPPFTTDTLLKEANDKLWIWASELMKIAQDLFEAWLITYHRTDSIHISDTWIWVAKEFLKEKNLLDYFYPRHWWAEWTHEAIRPTKPYDIDDLKSLIESWLLVAKLTYNHYRVYNLILKRFVASQMRSFEYEEWNVNIKFVWINYDRLVQLPLKVLKNWWNLIIPIWIYDLDDWIYKVQIDKKLVPKVIPYTQWTLISEMKEKGLWRPSTYATIVSTLLKRKYIIQIPKLWWLKHTKKWKEVYDFLMANYKNLVSETFTKILEEKMDKVEQWEDHFKILFELFEKLKEYRLVK